MINIKNIDDNNNFNIEISNLDFVKMENVIQILRNKYINEIEKLYFLEKQDADTYDYMNFHQIMIREKKLMISVIKDVLEFYAGELKNLECAFLSGSYARGTNKIASDIDLHLFYLDDTYNYVYEEIISYIISKILMKDRDAIDPTFILNLQSKYKKEVTNKMSSEKLKIRIVSNDNVIEYFYKSGKKRRFYLQYNNSRNINDLKDYIIKEISVNNLEWAHCFEVVYGEEIFSEMYSQILEVESSIVDKNYINNKIQTLKKKIEEFVCRSLDSKNISALKKRYQSDEFELIYEYLNIIRFQLKYLGYNVPLLNLDVIYKITQSANFSNEIFNDIYKYLWQVKNLSIYCYKNNINYGLHNYDIIDYNPTCLEIESKKLNKKMLINLMNMEEKV